MDTCFEEIQSWLGDKTVRISELIEHLQSQSKTDDEIRSIISALPNNGFSVMKYGDEEESVHYKGATVEKRPPDMNPFKRTATITHSSRKRPIIKPIKKK